MENLLVTFARTLRSVPSLGAYNSCKFFLSSIFKGDHFIKPKICPYPVCIRGSSVDVLIFYQVFCRNTYRVPKDGNINVIIDAGAHVGLVSVYFACLAPMATIISVEMELVNFDRLVQNTKFYSRIHPVHAAIWPRQEALVQENPTGESWSFRCKAPDEHKVFDKTIDAITIEELQRLYNFDCIDLLKLDIEGGEAELFAEDCPWLNKIKHMYLEIHQGNWKTVFDRLSAFQYDGKIEGENIYITFT